MADTISAKEANDWFEKNKPKKMPAVPVGGASIIGPITIVGTQPDECGHANVAPSTSATPIVLPSICAGDLAAFAPAKSVGASKEEEIVLSSRTPNELLKMEFDAGDNYFENGVLARYQSCSILGPGGVGKSRFALLMAVCSAAGLPFLGWKPSKKKLRWLIIQAENSTRRLQADLQAFRAWIGEEAWPLVEKNVIIHTLEKDHDAFLSVGAHGSAELLARLIKDTKADVVVFDPLYAFASGNLNTDAAMLKTLKSIGELARRGKLDCAIIVVHHTLTGKEGARKAVGFDRASYGRGSKALHFWTRAQINLVPVNADDNGRLVVACGKNSNGPEFMPFGIWLNPTTMVYEVDEQFDLETWKNEFLGETNSVIKPTPEALAALVKDLPLSRKALKDLVMEELGCGQASAYALIAKSEGKTIRRNAKKEYEAVAK